MRFAQERELITIQTLTRGISVEEGGYHWRGELRLWDQEVLMGWYTADDGSVLLGALTSTDAQPPDRCKNRCDTTVKTRPDL